MTDSVNISIYTSVKDTASTQTIGIDQFLEAIKSGRWQDRVLKIRTIEDIELRRAEKAKLPNVTISGIFTKRVDKECKLHSGFIGVDIDNLGSEVESTRALLQQDPYVYSAFTSVSGTGLCALIRIDPERHRDAFEGIADYMIKKYQIIVDPTGVNVSRARFVSFDPDLFVQKSSVFKKYLTKTKTRKIQATIFVQTEFDDVIRQMVDLRVSCVEDYRDWRDIGFGLADQFGEGGRQYFHSLSSCSDKYETSMCDRQYTHCLRSNNNRGGSKVTIATIYWFAKQAGIQVLSERTKKIAAATTTLKKNGLNAADIAENLAKFDGITGADDIIKQAFATNQDFAGGESVIENVRVWLRHNYQIKRNVITRKLENNGVILQDIELNTIFLEAKIAFDDLTFELFLRILLSSNTPQYNPFTDFLDLADWDGVQRLPDLAKSINSHTGDEEYRELMVRKWVVGIVHSMMGETSELQFVLVGGKNTGKTSFFRNLLPPKLRSYFAESQLNRGKDDEILMCEKLIVFNDEYGGKNKMDERNEKRLMASSEFTLREPYGKSNITLKRLANLCGTCNEKDVLDDPTGNRRIIVIESAGKFFFDLYNSIDKEQLFYEAYELWKRGERPVLSDIDIACLEEVTDGEYSKVSFEAEMIEKHFESPDKSNDFKTTSEIKNKLENHTREKININKLGAQLRKLGYIREKRDNKYGYVITEKGSGFSIQLPVTLPF